MNILAYKNSSLNFFNSLSRGVSRLGDFKREINKSYEALSFISHDNKVMREDWEIIGKDIRIAISNYGKEEKNRKLTRRSRRK